METRDNTKRTARHTMDIRHPLWSFILSAVLTIFAFIAVGYDVIENSLMVALFIFLLAVIQIIVQLFYFMHMKERGHFFFR